VQRGLILQASAAAAWAEQEAWHDYVIGRAADEEDLTDRFLTRLTDSVASISGRSGFKFDARTLTHRRSGEEKRFGADFAVKLDIDTPDQQACFGWIAQAKIADRARWTGTAVNPALREQCEVMLGITSASFAVLYAPETRVFGANDVAALVGPTSYRAVSSRGVRHHFRDFLSGAFGDRAVCTRVFDSAVVRDRRRRYGADNAAQLVPVGSTLSLYFGPRKGDRYETWAARVESETDVSRGGDGP
jgi:hypothetical protein